MVKMNLTGENIKTDRFCLMPNHIHGIIVIRNQPANAPEDEKRRRRSLQDVLRGFKSASARKYGGSAPEDEHDPLWQPSFYDEVIRNADMLYEVRRYIDENPKKWASDEYFI